MTHEDKNKNFQKVYFLKIRSVLCNRVLFYNILHRKTSKKSIFLTLPYIISAESPFSKAGAIGCRERVANILDCEGEHISGKNGNYCELTALYWIWKNRLTERWSGDGEGYYGLCHYRRMLELTEDDILRLTDNDVDVVLPFPLPYEPDMGAHHRRYLSEGDWGTLRAALKELYPDYAAALAEIERQPYLYNYNIILARKRVLEEYCGWLFPLLERIEERSIPRGSERH